MRRRPDQAVGRSFLLTAMLVLATACAPTEPIDEALTARPFELRSLAQSDVDIVVEIVLTEQFALLEELAGKLYRRNPRELWKTPHATMEERIAELFHQESGAPPARFEDMRGLDVLRLSLERQYRDDRVFAFVLGLSRMIHDSYGGKREFYALDSLDPQKLYNCARNIEIAVWKLSQDLGPDGQPLLYSNSLPGETANLSYERLFGKLIGMQDVVALVIADRSNRVIRRVVHTMATAVFLPI